MSAETMGSPDKAPPARHVLPYEAIEKSRWRHTPQAHEDAIAAAREKRRLAEAQAAAVAEETAFIQKAHQYIHRFKESQDARAQAGHQLTRIPAQSLAQQARALDEAREHRKMQEALDEDLHAEMVRRRYQEDIGLEHDVAKINLERLNMFEQVQKNQSSPGTTRAALLYRPCSMPSHIDRTDYSEHMQELQSQIEEASQRASSEMQPQNSPSRHVPLKCKKESQGHHDNFLDVLGSLAGPKHEREKRSGHQKGEEGRRKAHGRTQSSPCLAADDLNRELKLFRSEWKQNAKKKMSMDTLFEAAANASSTVLRRGQERAQQEIERARKIREDVEKKRLATERKQQEDKRKHLEDERKQQEDRILEEMRRKFDKEASAVRKKLREAADRKQRESEQAKNEIAKGKQCENDEAKKLRDKTRTSDEVASASRANKVHEEAGDMGQAAKTTEKLQDTLMELDEASSVLFTCVQKVTATREITSAPKSDGQEMGPVSAAVESSRQSPAEQQKVHGLPLEQQKKLTVRKQAYEGSDLDKDVEIHKRNWVPLGALDTSTNSIEPTSAQRTRPAPSPDASNDEQTRPYVDSDNQEGGLAELQLSVPGNRALNRKELRSSPLSFSPISFSVAMQIRSDSIETRWRPTEHRLVQPEARPAVIMLEEDEASPSKEPLLTPRARFESRHWRRGQGVSMRPTLSLGSPSPAPAQMDRGIGSGSNTPTVGSWISLPATPKAAQDPPALATQKDLPMWAKFVHVLFNYKASEESNQPLDVFQKIDGEIVFTPRRWRHADDSMSLTNLHNLSMETMHRDNQSGVDSEGTSLSPAAKNECTETSVESSSISVHRSSFTEASSLEVSSLPSASRKEDKRFTPWKGSSRQVKLSKEAMMMMSPRVACESMNMFSPRVGRFTFQMPTNDGFSNEGGNSAQKLLTASSPMPSPIKDSVGQVAKDVPEVFHSAFGQVNTIFKEIGDGLKSASEGPSLAVNGISVSSQHDYENPNMYTGSYHSKTAATYV